MHRIIYILTIILFANPGFSQDLKKEYFSNGNLKSECKVINGKPDGILKLFFETGEIQGLLNFKDGQQNGSSLTYYPNGKLMKEMMFKNGEQVDTMKIYFESGPLQEVSVIVGGKKSGYYRQYYENGQIKLKGKTKESLLDGYAEHFQEDGKLEAKGEYSFGKKVGNWVEYNNAGVTQKQYKPSEKNILPSKYEELTFATEGFIVKYPNSWKKIEHQNPAIKFAAMPMKAEGIFKENVTIIAQPVPKEYDKLDYFIDNANATLKKKYNDFEIIRDTKGNNENITYRDLFYSFNLTTSTALINLKTWTRYFIRNSEIYQISFTGESDTFKSIEKEASVIFNSFKFKK